MLICPKCDNIIKCSRDEEELLKFLENEPEKEKFFNIHNNSDLCMSCTLQQYKDELNDYYKLAHLKKGSSYVLTQAYREITILRNLIMRTRKNLAKMHYRRIK